jgi:hypothetical protein
MQTLDLAAAETSKIGRAKPPQKKGGLQSTAEG